MDEKQPPSKPPSTEEIEQVSHDQALITDEWASQPPASPAPRTPTKKTPTQKTSP